MFSYGSLQEARRGAHIICPSKQSYYCNSLLSVYCRITVYLPVRVMQQLSILQVAACIHDDADMSPGLCALTSATVVPPLLPASAVSHSIAEFQMR